MCKGIVSLEPVQREGRRQIRLQCAANESSADLIKNIPGCRWDQEQQCWYAESNAETLSHIFRVFHRKAWVNVDALVA